MLTSPCTKGDLDEGENFGSLNHESYSSFERTHLEEHFGSKNFLIEPF